MLIYNQGKGKEIKRSQSLKNQKLGFWKW